jgi:hypothetical protein
VGTPEAGTPPCPVTSRVRNDPAVSVVHGVEPAQLLPGVLAMTE